MEKAPKIRAKLAKWRQEAETLQSMSSRHGGNSSAVASQAASDHTARCVAADSVADIDSRTTISDGSIILSTRKEVKRQFDQIVRAINDTFRSVGTCEDCRSKKIQCYISHHALEDLLIDYSDAADDVQWALEHDGDPQQTERDILSRGGPRDTPRTQGIAKLSRIYDIRWTLEHDTDSKQAEPDNSSAESSSPMNLVQWAQAALWSMDSQDTAFELLVSALAEETHMDLD